MADCSCSSCTVTLTVESQDRPADTAQINLPTPSLLLHDTDHTAVVTQNYVHMHVSVASRSEKKEKVQDETR